MNPLIDLGFISIHWYSILLILAISIGGIIVYKESKKQGLSKDFVFDLLFYTVIFGLIGARLYYVLFNLDYYLNDPIEIIKVWNGGLAIHGGIIAGLTTIIVYCKKKQINSLLMLDIIVLGLIIAQAIGRWGNFFNMEAYGGEISRETLQSFYLPNFIIEGMYINGTYHIPTFLMESIWCLLGFILLLVVFKRKNNKIGETTSLYLIIYGLGRFFIEALRTDSLLIFNIKMAQVVSISMVVIGVVLFIISSKKQKKYHKGD